MFSRKSLTVIGLVILVSGMTWQMWAAYYVRKGIAPPPFAKKLQAAAPRTHAAEFLGALQSGNWNKVDQEAKRAGLMKQELMPASQQQRRTSFAKKDRQVSGVMILVGAAALGIGFCLGGKSARRH